MASLPGSKSPAPSLETNSGGGAAAGGEVKGGPVFTGQCRPRYAPGGRGLPT